MNIQFKSSTCYTSLGVIITIITQYTGNMRKSKPPNNITFRLSYMFPHRGSIEIDLVGDEDGIITADVEIEIGAA